MDWITSKINVHSSTPLIPNKLPEKLKMTLFHIYSQTACALSSDFLFILPLSLSVSCSLFNPAIYLFSGLALHKTMRAIPLSVEGERTLSMVLQGPVLSGNLCCSMQSDWGSAVRLSNKHSCLAFEASHVRPAVLFLGLDFLTLTVTLFILVQSEPESYRGQDEL